MPSKVFRSWIFGAMGLSVATMGAPGLRAQSATVKVEADAINLTEALINLDRIASTGDAALLPPPGGGTGGGDPNWKPKKVTGYKKDVLWTLQSTWGSGAWSCLSHKPFSKDDETLSIEREWSRAITGGGTLGIDAVTLKFEQSTSKGGKDTCNSTGKLGEWVWFYQRDLTTQNDWEVIGVTTYDDGTTTTESLNKGYIQAVSGVDWNPKKVWGNGPA